MSFPSLKSLKIELATARKQSADAKRWADMAVEYVKMIEAEIAKHPDLPDMDSTDPDA